MSDLTNMPDELLAGLYPLALERHERTRAATLPYEPTEKDEPAYLNAFKEYQDAIVWKHQLRRELQRRGLRPAEREVA